jgi:hypothetical protein
MTRRPDETARVSAIDRSAWTSVKALAELVGKWWVSVWVLTILSGVVSFGLTVANIASIPTAVWAGLLTAGLVLGPSVAFHSLRIERDSYRALWDDGDVVIRLLRQLEKLRAEGARLQIEGRQVLKPQFDDWAGRVAAWRKRTIRKLTQLHPAEAGNFTTLGVFDAKLTAGTKIISDKHQTEMLNMVRRLEILADVRDRWTSTQ